MIIMKIIKIIIIIIIIIMETFYSLQILHYMMTPITLNKADNNNNNKISIKDNLVSL